MDLLYKEKLTTKGDFGFNRTAQELCEMRTFLHILRESMLSPHFDIFWFYLGFHQLVLLFNILFKWDYRRSRDIAYCIRKSRKHAGCVIGVFSVMISWKFFYSEGNCQSDIYLALFSFLLSAIALFCFRRFKINCFTVLSILICLCSSFLIIAAVRNSLISNSEQDFTAQFLYGILHFALGLNLLLVSQRKNPIGKIFLPNSGNLFYIELTN